MKFMLSLRVTFLKHKDSKTLGEFWPKTNKEFLSRWPAPDPSLDDLKSAADSLKNTDLDHPEVVRFISRVQMSFVADMLTGNVGEGTDS